MHAEDCQLKIPTPSVCHDIFVTRRPVVCGYDQIFIEGGVPAIGESQVLCLKQTGEWRALQLVRVKGNPPIPELLNTSI